MELDAIENHEKITVAAIFIVSLAGGAMISDSDISLTGSATLSVELPPNSADNLGHRTQSEIREMYSSLYQMLRETNRYNSSQNNVGIVQEKPPKHLERILRSNIEVIKSSYGKPAFEVETNNRGLREEEFNTTPPENTTRILVLGDSYVYGSGVNKSDRYTDILEKRLNSNSEKSYQVINAGIFGAGVKDYYLFLKHRGLEYNPDMVIVGVIGNDWMPLELEKELSRNASDYVNRNYPNASDRRQNELSSERFLDLQSENQDLDGYSVLRNLSALAAKNEIKTLVYASDYMADEKMRKVRKYGDTENSTLVYAPREFRDDWHSKFCLRYSPNRVSMIDPHPSPEGHRMLADRLYREITDKGEPLLPWSYGGFDQWIDPC